MECPLVSFICIFESQIDNRIAVEIPSDKKIVNGFITSLLSSIVTNEKIIEF